MWETWLTRTSSADQDLIELLTTASRLGDIMYRCQPKCLLRQWYHCWAVPCIWGWGCCFHLPGERWTLNYTLVVGKKHPRATCWLLPWLPCKRKHPFSRRVADLPGMLCWLAYTDTKPTHPVHIIGNWTNQLTTDNARWCRGLSLIAKTNPRSITKSFTKGTAYYNLEDIALRFDSNLRSEDF